ncbi:phytanoyl-CoA dioxygenase family protein [Undibacterium sp. TJN19]|uniref:phytanoyl-CoA dioxygenase family protein n=1 Tax=Undibacterium sp. TJN19 TaxID=3413055 RepID=UPI003BF25171
MHPVPTIAETLAQQGYVIVRQFLDQAELRQLRQACQPIENEYGVRQVLLNYPAIAKALPSHKLQRLLQTLAMPDAQQVRSLFFNKNAAHNWLVPWHQDMSICLKHKSDAPGFHKWTFKHGVHHVEAPAAILEAMTTLRIALDDANVDNGALKVLTASHLHGKLDSQQIAQYASSITVTCCELQAGDLLLMKPLLLHASDKAQHASGRRVLHMEFSVASLPAQMQWAEADINATHSL